METIIYIRESDLSQFWTISGSSKKRESYSIIFDLTKLWHDRPNFDILCDRLFEHGFEQTDLIDIGPIDKLMDELTVVYEHFFAIEIFRNKVCSVSYYQRIDLVSEFKDEEDFEGPSKTKGK